jgi:pSer/pThr/pTyr-binding forkhead associated (FHA) protein
MGGIFNMDKKCPYCGAETRPGDNYCLNCGNPLLPATPSSPSVQGQAPMGDSTLAAPDDWAASVQNQSLSSPWSDLGGATIANSSSELPGQQVSYDPTVKAATADRIDRPARFILRSENGDIVEEYTLDKPEISIGRAPQSDILLSKDKLTSRRHATVHYENNQYVLRDERSANGTFVNGQQVEEMTPYVLQDGDHVGIGEHELVFRTYESVANNVENLPTIAVPPEAIQVEQQVPGQERTYRTQPDGQATVATSNPEDYRTQQEFAEVEASQEAVAPEVPDTPNPALVLPVATSYPSEAEVVPATPVPARFLLRFRVRRYLFLMRWLRRCPYQPAVMCQMLMLL